MRTRFAPSPTGLLHIGGLRTALFAWLVAKQKGGTFFLRIEDTDRAREVAGATRNIVETLTWAGLKPDEGVTLDDNGEVIETGSHGPYHQSQRLDIYRKHVDELLEKKHAYHCFCTSERLEEMRTYQAKMRQAPMYDRTCLSLTKEEIDERLKKGEKHVIRMHIPRERTVTFTDEIYGELSFKGHTIDDQVLLKSDGFPTYHLAHVVDDHLMKTDMVIRGEEWVSSLPKHILLFEYFGWTPPRYAHLPLLLNQDRSKLSKRQNDVSADSYKQQGYLPETLINFLALLGWNPGTTQEMFTMKELLEAFSLERVQKAGAVFDVEKLKWLQGQWMRKIPVTDFAQRIMPLIAERYPKATDEGALTQSFLEKAGLIQERITFFSEAPDMLGFFYEEPEIKMEIILNPKQKVTQEILSKVIEILFNSLDTIDSDNWRSDVISSALEDAIQATGLKKGQVLWPLRAILTGREYSPGAFEVAAALGKEKTMKRLSKAGKLLIKTASGE